MKAKVKISGIYSIFTYLKALFAAVLILFSLNSCSTKDPFTIVTFKGKGTVVNLSKSNLWVNGEADSLHPVSLLVGKGDLIILNNNIVYYKNTGEKSLSFRNDKSFGYINDKLNSITISKDENLLPWFKTMKEKDILSLETIAVTDTLPESYISFLTNISKVKPNIGICADISKLPELLKIFSPLYMILENVKQTDVVLLKDLNNLELLYITLNDTLYSEALPAMPKLKQLIISEIDDSRIISLQFLKNNPQIERLVLVTKNGTDFSFIKPIQNLKHISICGFEHLSGWTVLGNYKHLESICLIGEYMKEFSVFNNLKELRWLTLPVNTPQAEFNALIENHPNLEVLEIVKNDTIKDFSPLLNLPKLIGLTIADTLTDFNTLLSMKQLKFISVPAKFARDSVKMATLKKSLPNCTVATNEGFCLGSGWLLLIIPFIWLTIKLTSKKLYAK